MKSSYLTLVKILSKYFWAFVCFFIAACLCLWMFRISAEPIRALKNSDNEELRQAYYATLNKKALGVAFDAYKKRYGKYGWEDMMAQDFKKGIRWDKVVEASLFIDDESVQNENFVAYQLLVDIGQVELARELVDVLNELREKGGAEWKVARSHSMASVVRMLTRKDESLWKWYICGNNSDWVDPYLQNVSIDEAQSSMEAKEMILGVLRELKNHELLYKSLDYEIKKEYAGLLENDEDFEVNDIYSCAICLISEYAEIFTAALRSGAPIAESIIFLYHNQDYYRYSDFEGRCSCNLTVKEKEARGVEMGMIFRDCKSVWAAGVQWSGAVYFWKVAPEVSDAVLGEFAACGVTELLGKYYKRDKQCFRNAIWALFKYGDIAFAALFEYKEDETFKRLLANEKIRDRLIPYLLFRGPQETFSKIEDDPRWIDEYLNVDGTIKKEKYDLIETLPLFGGICTVAKKWYNNRPITGEDVFWCVFDGAEIVITISTFGAGQVVTAPAKAAAKTAAKTTLKTTVKSTGKLMAQKTAKSLLVKTASQSGKLSKVERFASFKNICVAMKKVVAIGGNARSILKERVKSIGKIWSKLPQPKRNYILRATSLVMVVLVVKERTLPRMPSAISSSFKDAGCAVGNLIEGFTNGIANFVIEGVRAFTGETFDNRKILGIVLIVIFMIFGFVSLGVNLNRKKIYER